MLEWGTSLETSTCSLFQNHEHIEASREHQLDDSRIMHLDPLILHLEDPLIEGLPSILSPLEDEHPIQKRQVVKGKSKKFGRRVG
jgi:predicted oxidoreductase